MVQTSYLSTSKENNTRGSNGDTRRKKEQVRKMYKSRTYKKNLNLATATGKINEAFTSKKPNKGLTYDYTKHVKKSLKGTTTTTYNNQKAFARLVSEQKKKEIAYKQQYKWIQIY